MGGGWGTGSNDAFVRQINNFRMRPHATCTQMRHFLCRLLCCTQHIDIEKRERDKSTDSEMEIARDTGAGHFGHIVNAWPVASRVLRLEPEDADRPGGESVGQRKRKRQRERESLLLRFNGS